MKPYIISLAAGALCLPLTYWPNRYGALGTSTLIILAVAIGSTWLSRWYMNHTNRSSEWGTFPLAFALGAGASEALFFAYYYFDYGYRDPKLGVGVTLAVWEGGAIAFLGGLTVTMAFFAIRRKTNTLRATR
jgi:hypothetical protein